MRWPFFLAVFLSISLLPARAGHTPPKVVLRVHVQTTGEGQSPLEVSKIAIPPTGEQILIRAIPELSEVQLLDVQQDESGLRLKFDHAGRVNLSAVTAQNPGRILVVLIDGQVVYAPTIDTQITDGELDIPHQLPPAIVQLLQQVAKENQRQANRT